MGEVTLLIKAKQIIEVLISRKVIVNLMES